MDRQYKIQERFLGFEELEVATASNLFEVLKQKLEKWGIDIYLCRGQSYDGAVNMSGHVSGL